MTNVYNKDITSSELQDEPINTEEVDEESQLNTNTQNINKTGTQVSDEQLDEIADTVILILRDVLKYFNVGEVTIDEYEGDEGELILDITGDHLEVLIGRHGRTLEALHFLIMSITTRKIGYRYPIIIDVESYKSRQRQKLESLAVALANKAASQNRSVKMRPMTPYERRIIHIALRDDVRVETASEGEGLERHIVIVPTK